MQINVTPEKSRRADIFVLTCADNPNEERTYGFEPPREVKRQLEKSSQP